MSLVITLQIPFQPEPYMATYEVRNTSVHTAGGGVMYDIRQVGGPKITEVEHRRDRGVTELASKALQALRKVELDD